MHTIGGIRQTGPAWREITFHSVCHSTASETVVLSPHGPIRSKWKKQGGKIRIELGVRPGIKARIELPGLPVQVIRKSQQWILPTP
jgi:alpha-L-rhamnosidase